MKLINFTYKEKGKNKTIRVKPVSIFSFGLMFRKKSPNLLFSMKKERTFSIHSFFCKPFKAIWLDENNRITKNVDVKPWKIISGKGKYLIEIPSGTT